MNKITLHGKKLNLIGNLIKKGDELIFTALDRERNERSNEEFKGKYIISVFPDIETSVCDKQTMKIAKLATKYSKTKFLSISTDKVKKINKWCAAKGIDNIDIWSDKNLDFGHKTNALLKAKKVLARGFIIMDGTKVLEVSFKEELAEMPDFELIKKHI